MATTTSSLKRSRKNKASDASGPGGPWTGHAPRRLRKAYQGDANVQGWALWRKYLAKRKLRPIAKLFQGGKSPLLWALPPEANVKQAEQAIELLRRPHVADRHTAGVESAAQSWLSRAEVAAPDFDFALACLAWAAALPALAEHLDEAVWWQIANRLIEIATAESRGDDPLAGQMLHGELSAALAYLLPELAAGRALVSASQRTLEQSSDELLNDEAMVHGSRLEELRPLLACWTRWRTISQELDAAIWSDGWPRRYSRLVENALRMTRLDGTQCFAPAGTARWNRRLQATALALVDRPKTQRVARLIASGGRDDGGPRRRSTSPSIELESAGVAVLRANWQRRSPQLAVNFAGAQLQLELSLGRQILCASGVEVDLRIDNQALVPRQGWNQICWESDGDVDYLELELCFAENITVQRHLVLAREAGFLLAADAVLGTVSRNIQYRAMLPLAEGVAFRPEQESREGTLDFKGRARARVFPLELSEWRSGLSRGTLEADADGGSLVLAQQCQGRSMFAPLFIDLDPRRLRSEATWRQLTVAENRQVVPRDEAVGYRMQIGKQQWLIYRSLGDVGIRTVLGHNLMNEFLIGRFRSKGDVKALLEIEA